VPRQALCERIARADPARVVLVRAPAGFGKTTALRQARARLEAEGRRCAWLALERADNDVSRLLARLAETLAPLAAEGAPPQADPARWLAELPLPFALFLDDLEQLQDPAALATLRRLIDRLPEHGLLVLASRGQPELGLARLRVAGQLAEIDTEDLRFSLADTGEFLRRRGQLALSATEVAGLHHKTEGWVAALWLASLAMNRHGAPGEFIARFSGTERSVAEYLAEDVLAQQSPQAQAFLLRTSVVRELTLPLADALHPRADNAALLRQLEADGIFLNPVPPRPGAAPAWRYHSLFADFLQARLAQWQPQEVQRLHLVAAAWYEAGQRPVPAIDHLIEGGDHPHALALLAQHAEHFLARGRMRLLARWFQALPADALHTRPLLQVVAAWATCFTQGPWEAWRLLEALAPEAGDDALVQGHAASLRPLLLSMMDRFEEAHAAGRAGLARLPSPTPFADRALINTMASVAAVMGELQQARRLLETARHGREASRFEQTFTEGMQALLDLQDGRLREASSRLRLILSPAPGAGEGSAHNANAWLGVLYASVVHELGQTERAAELLDVHLPLARDIGLPDHMILSHTLRARIAVQRGEPEAALEALAELAYLGTQRRLPRVSAAARIERAWLFMRQGHAQAARDELDLGDDTTLWARVAGLKLPAHDTSDLALGRLRWELCFGDPAAARRAIAAERQRCGQAGKHHRPRRALLLLLLEALALDRAGQGDGALAMLGQWLSAAAASGAMRMLLDEGAPAIALLRRLHEQPPAGVLASPLVRDHLQRLLDAAGPAPRPDTTTTAPATLAEPLSRKELRVLELLVEGLSNSAMAERLFVSDSTIRTHLRNINQKTGARSRTQAVAIARRLGLLP
jgi:LuxR family maltose regulon positive regulatory protein